jgi:hypothetical protein
MFAWRSEELMSAESQIKTVLLCDSLYIFNYKGRYAHPQHS